MSPTLADVHMLTGLNIIGHINPFSLLVKPTAKLDSTKTRGWFQYIINHKADGKSVFDREHMAFLNMWLDKYVFCGQAYSPTSNYLTLVEKIAGNSEIPLGKILLGALYNLLNKVSQHLMENETVPTITGPWWVLQLWFNSHLHKLVTPELINLSFSSLEYPEEQEEHLPKSQKFRRCMSFGEATSVITIDASITDFFKLFYKDFPEATLEWFVYSDILEFELPASFRFQNIYSYAEEFKILSHLVRPSLLPTEIRHGREKPLTSYEFYCPSIVSRQMGFDQLPC